MPKRTTIRSWFEDLVSLCFPDLCVCCNNNLYRGETLICMKCLHRLPKNDMHYEKGNILEKKFWGKADVERVTSFLRYIKKSDVQRLINKLKYKGEKEIGVFLGKYAAAELVDNDVFGSVDVIVPVPLHKSKYRKRGYNQSRCIADGMAEIMGIPVDEGNLYRAVENPTQTRKSTYERWENTKGIFELTDGSLFDGKHILLVDDVLTTGSTLIACVEAIREKSNAKISVFTLASA